MPKQPVYGRDEWEKAQEEQYQQDESDRRIGHAEAQDDARLEDNGDDD